MALEGAYRERLGRLVDLETEPLLPEGDQSRAPTLKPLCTPTKALRPAWRFRRNPHADEARRTSPLCGRRLASSASRRLLTPTM